MKLRGESWPVFGWIDDMRLVLARARQRNRSVALATIVALDGSAPRQLGTQMVFDGAEASGHFSGGCIEADIANHAATVVASGEPALLKYGAKSPWIDIRLACGAGIEILVECIRPDDAAIASLLALTSSRCPVCWTSNGQSRTANPDEGKSRLAFTREPLCLTMTYEPTWRLVVIGGDPTALAIAQLASQSGIETILLCPGGPEAPPPIDCADYRRGEANVELEAIALDPWTALAIAIHEPEIEHRILLASLPSDAGYVGVLGAAARVPEILAPGASGIATVIDYGSS